MLHPHPPRHLRCSVAATPLIAVAVNPSSPLVLRSFTHRLGKYKCFYLITMPPLDPFNSTEARMRLSDRDPARVARQLAPTPTNKYTHTRTHTHTHIQAPWYFDSARFTHNTGPAPQQARRGPSTTPQQDAAPRPRQRHNKQDAAPRQRHRLPKTFPLVTRQGSRSTRRDRFRRPSISTTCCFHHYPRTSTWLFSSLSLIGTHSLPTHCIHHRPGAFWLSS
jgi:hypothetical protein